MARARIRTVLEDKEDATGAREYVRRRTVVQGGFPAPAIRVSHALYVPS